MRNLLRTVSKASRLVRKGRPISAGLALQALFAPAPRTKKSAPKRAKPPGHGKACVRAARPLPGTFVDGCHAGAQGRLSYKLYTPAGSNRRRMPLVVMLHGCTQTAAGFARSTRMNELADELGFIVLYPEQAASANFARCWNWHSPANQLRGAGEPAAIAELTRHALAATRANPARVYIAGISAGGAAAAIIGSAYPDLYAAVGVHSGLSRGAITSMSGAMLAMRDGIDPGASGGKASKPLPTIVFHGDQDSVVHPSNAKGFHSQLRRSGRTALVEKLDAGRSAGGRNYTRARYFRGGTMLLEEWTVHGSGHAWSGGSAAGSFTDPAGPDASREMMRFFLAHRQTQPRR